jgi:hypothetical protein
VAFRRRLRQERRRVHQWGWDEDGTFIPFELVHSASLVHLLETAATRRELIPPA